MKCVKCTIFVFISSLTYYEEERIVESKILFNWNVGHTLLTKTIALLCYCTSSLLKKLLYVY